MPQKTARRHRANPSKIKDRWARLLSKNAIVSHLVTYPELGRLQEATLAEFRSLLGTKTSQYWFRLHRPHTKPLGLVSPCGFPVCLVYFALGEQALLGEGPPIRGRDTPEVAKARFLWRSLAQREMEAQCDGCGRICSLVSFSRGAVGPIRDRVPLTMARRSRKIHSNRSLRRSTTG